MKHVLSMVTFVMAGICFVIFMITVKPDELSAVASPSKPAHCKMVASRAPVCRSER